MTDVPVLGFKAFLQRTYGQTVLDIDREVANSSNTPNKSVVVVEKESENGDETIVDIQGSSNIKSLRYNRKLKRLTTWFVSGSFKAYADVSPGEFEAVIHPSEEFGYSVGKAHYALIRSKKD